MLMGDLCLNIHQIEDYHFGAAADAAVGYCCAKKYPFPAITFRTRLFFPQSDVNCHYPCCFAYLPSQCAIHLTVHCLIRLPHRVENNLPRFVIRYCPQLLLLLLFIVWCVVPFKLEVHRSALSHWLTCSPFLQIHLVYRWHCARCRKNLRFCVDKSQTNC